MMNKLKHLRIQKGFTHEELSDEACICRSSLSGWENGNSQPKMNSLRSIANVLEVRVIDLIEDNQINLIEQCKAEQRLINLVQVWRRCPENSRDQRSVEEKMEKFEKSESYKLITRLHA